MSASPYLPAMMSDVVVDLSHYENVSQDFVTTVKAGIAAVILKATEGAGYTDQTFLPRVAEARAVGLLVGAYHFLNGDDPASQVAHFLTIAQSEGGVDWLALDWEPSTSSQASVQQAMTAASTVRAATGRWPVLYTIRYMLSVPNKTLSNCPLWLAEYGTRPICPQGFASWRMWQHTDGNVGFGIQPVPGIGFCDRSKFAGTVEQLRVWWDNPTC